MRARFDYTGCKVFVAGGTSGINLGIAKAFAAAGARLAVASRNPGKVEAAAASLGEGALGYAVDVRDAAATEAAFAAFASEAGPIDVVVSGAAGNFPSLAKDLTPNGFKAVIDIDLIGTFHVMRAAYPHMRRPGGSLINISAPQATIAMPMQLHVCAAKAGVDMVTRCLAVEWGPEGLRVNGVVPGPIDGTEGMARLAPTEGMRAAIAASVPLGRLGTPEDVAGACLWLGSDAASYVNGTIVFADGGWAERGAPVALPSRGSPR
ncbi:NAD(P)-dependent dehydrogenase (short-subunit alcohol dehydrogenase family) [Amaricoccus macauensis]|uniref:NAD(P)-dependent dehydrogenase (Short-subunit alcohol dehydrogenase family) n=1 Tax=Amaricoccus macauensis TaxID=57001 RepID=A0A840SK80_9RHOB|nr:SDR family oxidoreductase [Amaricoccus macauensis]MBB5220558.1 NAD(P)-dependent dehydrogenase (short-subunit alcohol dehydrogenase family) [Amaricoccus macauensis]